ncbi:hypothetical protein NLJ89_g5722 [Agrocybe chaxingu]|uniref:N-acetyltransferase domain-containing protein n=1 Tax=Agrocybe chaxingu TaxID=84603 RepID=A0A9W8K1X6_9AGAR|nr:hypothetical protein NLJ89_g5722 [Agrocybe chaxingu]
MNVSHVIQTRVRPFKKSDSEQVRELYSLAMLYGPRAPVTIALKHQIYKPFSWVLYTLFAGGLALSRHSSTQVTGMAMSATVLGLFLAWRRTIWSKFKAFCQAAVDGDLSDIGKSYSAVLPDSSKLDSSGFWVAEVADGAEVGKIIGAVGLASSTNTDPTTAELRRLVVSPSYQGHGVGSLLVNTLLEHARTRGLTSVFLSTSMYQRPAMQLYEHLGFVLDRKVAVQVKILFIVNTAYLHFYKIKL